MAAPFDDATTLLTTLSNAVKRVYHPDSYKEMYSRFGNKTNRVFKASKRRFEGNTLDVQVMDKNLHGTRVDTDPNADFPTARAHSAGKYTVTFNEAGGSSNDLRRFAQSLRVTHFDLKRVQTKQVEAGQFVKDLLKQSMDDVGEKMAIHRHLPSTGQLALVNGTPASNDNRKFASASAIGTTGGARFPVDNGSLAYFQPGMRLHSYTTTTLDYELEVTDVNPSDKSIGVYGINSSDEASSAVNINGLADNDALYLSGGYNKNILSLGSWFADPTSGESFFGKDRTTPTNRWMLPHRSGPSAETLLALSHIDDAFVEMGFVREEDDGAYAAIMEPALYQRMINVIGADKLITFPTTEQKGKVIANYGFDAVIYRHFAAGRIALHGDALAIPRKIRFLRLGDWETVFGYTDNGETGFEWLPGGDGGPGSIFKRLPSSTPGNGHTTTYQAEGLCVMADICLNPRNQIELANVKPV